MYLLIMFVLICVAMFFSLGVTFTSIAIFIDFLSLIFLFLLCVPILFALGLAKDFSLAFRITAKKDASFSNYQLKRSFKAVSFFSTLLIYASIFITLASLCQVFSYIENLASLLPSLSVAILPLLYSIFFCLLLLPVKAKLTLMLLEQGISND